MRVVDKPTPRKRDRFGLVRITEAGQGKSGHGCLTHLAGRR